MPEVADRYRRVRERVADLVLTLDPADLERSVPACPGWRVHDVVAHITGITDDALNGRLDGVATDPWTAAQVERGRGVPTADLVARWGEQAPVFEQFPLPVRVVIDLTTHEQDIRGAVDRPGARESDDLLWAFDQIAGDAVDRMSGLRIEVDGAAYGPDDAELVLVGERFEIYRVLLGRRSAEQIRGLTWRGGPPERVQDLVLFGPAPTDVIE